MWRTGLPCRLGLAHFLLLLHAHRRGDGMERDAPEVLALPSDFEKNNGCRSGTA